MILSNALRLLTVSALVFTVSACGSERNVGIDLIRSIPKQIAARRAGPQKIPPQVAAQALAATDKPVMLYEVENTGNQFLTLEIERNRAYQTFANSGRQSLIHRSGMIVATRGLGGDLMSVEEDALLRAITSRRGGTATYIQRFQTPEFVTEEHAYQCRVTQGKASRASSGKLHGASLVMTSDCEGDQGRFQETYVVDGSGYIVSAKQWLGPVLGYISTQSLRK